MSYRPEPPARPNQAKLVSLLARTITRPARWSSLAVALNVIAQLGLLVVTRNWPKQSPNGNTLRGVDFYPWRDLIAAVIRSARTFQVENGYLPSLASPTTFNERIFVRKFFAPMPMPSLADKLAAKEHVRALLGDEVLPVVAWVGDDIGDLLTMTSLAGRYFLKASHGCESQLLLNLPNDLFARRGEIEQWATETLALQYGYDWGEWNYCTFKPKLFLEEFIDFNGAQTPDDYKFFCFQGKVRLIEVDVDRFTEVRSALYESDWKYIPVNYGEAPIQRPRPANLQAMISAAETIAAGIDFVRVDLYTDGNSKIRFGEMTFWPGDACLHFSDIKFDECLGRLFDADPKSNVQLEY